jgi:hypothetical protein
MDHSLLGENRRRVTGVNMKILLAMATRCPNLCTPVPCMGEASMLALYIRDGGRGIQK